MGFWDWLLGSKCEQCGRRFRGAGGQSPCADCQDKDQRKAEQDARLKAEEESRRKSIKERIADLRKKLSDPNEQVREDAMFNSVEQLFQRGYESDAIELVELALRDPSSTIRYRAAGELYRMGSETSKMFIKTCVLDIFQRENKYEWEHDKDELMLRRIDSAIIQIGNQLHS